MYQFLFRITMIDPQAVYTSWKDLEAIQGAETVFLYYSMFTTIVFFLSILVTGKKNLGKTIALYFCLMLSASFFGSGYAIGNSTMLILSILILAMHLRESDSRIQKEVALLLIAVAAGFKLYPAIFGLLYLKEKRYKEAARLVIYGLVMIFAPFSVFGGVQGLTSWISNILLTMDDFYGFGRIQFIKGMVFTVLTKFMEELGGERIEMISGIAPWVFLILMVVLALRSRSRYRTVFFLAAGMIFFPSNVYRYTLCYLSIPLIMYIKNEDESECFRWQKVGEMILYGLLFTIPTWWGVLTSFELTFPYYTFTYVELYVYIIAYLLVIYMVISEIIIEFRQLTERNTTS